jgi:mannose-1-phosphate guanylyltransferase
MIHAVIMAGGAGTRFWPASRRDRPKQFLELADGRPLLRATFERVAPIIPADRIWVVSGQRTIEATRLLLPELPRDNVLGEPSGRDTAACAGYAAQVVLSRDPDGVCVVLPADHVIDDAERLRSALAAGARHVASEGGLLTFGVRPTRPETGYGYLKIGDAYSELGGWQVHRLERFVEKPDVTTARTYVASDGYLWNSGMFAWRAGDLLDEIRRQLPLLADGLQLIADAIGLPNEASTLREVYPHLPRTSLDFGIMEGAKHAWTIPLDFCWSDVGSWPALAEILARDPHGNVVQGRVLPIDACNNVLISEGPVVTAVDIEGVIVVATADAVLVFPAASGQRVREVVSRLQELGWDDVL